MNKLSVCVHVCACVNQGGILHVETCGDPDILPQNVTPLKFP